MILSHSVDPERDSPERMNGTLSAWVLTPLSEISTGGQDELYEQAKEGYYLTALPSDTVAGGFFHSDVFALIDRDSRIRGFYDGTYG